MLPLNLGPDRERLRILCLGAHSDDIEIGCAGTLLRWLEEYRRVEVTWVVLSAVDVRGIEARRSAQALLERAAESNIVLGDFEDGYLPADFRRAKAFFGDLGRSAEVDVVLTHGLEDRHQDHRLVAELTWQTWRNHLILEYEIPKYEGDLGLPNLYAPLPSKLADHKVSHLIEHFSSQRSKDWFAADAFYGLMRLRGLECRADTGYAEAFRARKIAL